MGNNFRLEFEDGTTKTVDAVIKPPKDIIQFVAGTTDPINTHGLKHQADKEYWRGANNLWKQVTELKPQFLDLHIEDSFFSWSGDNSTDERTKSANRLLDTLLRVYSGWTKKEVHLHLIGHSHGGNVINEFTKIIAKKTDFPQFWKIKSITYLSTPFFKEQHQLDHTKLHADCKIINVYNEYDITQRFVADFTLKNLEYLIFNFYGKDKIDASITALKAIDMSAYSHLTDFVVDNHTEGPAIWRTTHSILVEVEKIMEVVVKNIAFIGNTKIVSKEKKEFLAVMSAFHTFVRGRANVFNRNASNRNGGYGRSEFIEDLDLVGLLPIFNRIIHIEKGVSDSFLLSFLDNVLNEKEKGLIHKIDDTSWTPASQVNGAFETVHFNITDLDIYNKRAKKASFERFASGIENAMKRNDKNSLKEILMRMLSQFIAPADLWRIIDGIDWVEYIVTGELDAQCKEVRRNLTVYHGLVQKYNENLIVQKDIDDAALKVKPGSIPYLAMTSHGLSHTSLFSDPKHNVKEALTSAFSSGKNPGYKGD